MPDTSFRRYNTLMQRGRGFTILELVLTITLVGVMAAVFLPSFSFDPTRLKCAQERVAEDIRLAQTLAMTSGQRHGAFFDTANNRYVVFANSIVTPINNPADPSQQLIVDFTNDASFDGITMTSAVFGGLATLLFDAQGVPQDGNGVALTANGNVTLSNGSANRTVTVSPETGKVSTP